MREAVSSRSVVRAMLAISTVMTLMSAQVSVVTAQEKQPIDEETTKQMLSFIREANTLYKSEQWEQALELYEKAYVLSPQPALLYRMGKSAEGAGKTREAIGYYSRFVEALPNEDAAKKVAAKLPGLKATIPPTLIITSTPSNANVYIGSLTSTPVGSTPYEGEFEPGEVTVMVKLDGYQVYTQNFTFEGAEQESINASLIKAPNSEGNASNTLDSPADPKSGARLKKIGWVSTGVGIALLGAGGAFTFMQMGAEDDVNSFDKGSASDPAAGRQELGELKDKANSSWRNAMILYSAGGLLTAAGVGMVTVGMMRDADSDTALRFELSPTQGGARVGLSGSF